MLFNKLADGMKTPMNNHKVSKIINLLGRVLPSSSTHDDKSIDNLMLFAESFRLVTICTNCCEENSNFLVKRITIENGMNVWVRSLSKQFHRSSCIDSDSLVSLHHLGVINLNDLNQKIIARRKVGVRRKHHPFTNI